MWFPTQNNNYMIGSDSDKPTLTDAYGGNTKTFTVSGLVQLNLAIAYTPKVGEANRVLSVKVEYGFDETDLYQHTVRREGLGTTTLYLDEFQFTGATGGTEYKFTIDLPISYELCRVSIKEDGGANFGAATIRAALSGK